MADLQAIQDRSANSLAKAGTSDRYKDRTQSLLDLLEDNGIIWGKVLKAGNHPGQSAVVQPVTRKFGAGHLLTGAGF